MSRISPSLSLPSAVDAVAEIPEDEPKGGNRRGRSSDAVSILSKHPDETGIKWGIGRLRSFLSSALIVSPAQDVVSARYYVPTDRCATWPRNSRMHRAASLGRA